MVVTIVSIIFYIAVLAYNHHMRNIGEMEQLAEFAPCFVIHIIEGSIGNAFVVQPLTGFVVIEFITLRGDEEKAHGFSLKLLYHLGVMLDKVVGDVGREEMQIVHSSPMAHQEGIKQVVVFFTQIVGIHFKIGYLNHLAIILHQRLAELRIGDFGHQRRQLLGHGVGILSGMRVLFGTLHHVAHLMNGVACADELHHELIFG